jgi:hypothetical protein
MFAQTDGEKEGRRRSGRSSTQISTLGREFLHSHCSVVEVELEWLVWILLFWSFRIRIRILPINQAKICKF